MKLLNALALSTLFVGAVNAQSTTVSGQASGINVPAASLEVSPFVETGIRSHLTGNFSDDDNNANTIGAYFKPAFDLTYKGERIDFTLNYEIELTAAQGSGKGMAGNKSIKENSYAYNHPVMTSAFKLNPDWKINNMTEIGQYMHSDNNSGERSDTTSSDTRTFDIVSITDLEYKINDTISVATGHRIDWGTDYNKEVSAAPIAGNLSAISPNAGDNPSYIMNGSISTVKVKFTDAVSLKSYILIAKGTEYDTENADYYFYRSNNDLSVATIKDLDLALRYRIELYNPKGAADGSLGQTGRVIAAYALNKNWSANLVNTFKASSPLDSGKKSKYNNENYLGLAYRF